MTDRDRASGHPTWERPGGLGLPRSPEPEVVGAEERRPVAQWLGWSPTSWRARGQK